MPTALITGAAKRIGKSIALKLAEEGFDIAIHVNTSTTQGKKLASTLREFGIKAEVFPLDLSELEQIEGLFKNIVNAMGSIDVVVNNASMFVYDNVQDFDYRAAQKLLNVNLLAPSEITRCLAKFCPGEPSRDKDSLVVNILDNKVFSLNSDFYSYTLTKVALKGAGEMAAMGFAGQLRVNAIAPGITLISGDQSEESFNAGWRNSLSGTGATPEEIADTVFYMWTTKSINGETIVLDGGQRHLGLQRDVAFITE